jgi:hypothetical protein
MIKNVLGATTKVWRSYIGNKKSGPNVISIYYDGRYSGLTKEEKIKRP